MEVDYTGANAVANLIGVTGLTKFVISRVGASTSNKVPVFEFIEKSSVERTKAAFTEWASLTDNVLPYEMALFKDLEDCQAEGDEIRNKKHGKIIKFTFCLNKQEKYQQQQTRTEQTQNITELIENALMKQQLRNDNNEVLKKLQEMEQRMLEMESEEEDDTAELSGLNNPAVLNLISLLGKSLGGNKPTVVNGLQPEQITNINRAVKTLSKYDESLDTDLLKLANLAETNTATFEMLLKTLRNM
jgi:hypothetical protein